MKEIWKDVIGYEGLYQVSNLGRIKSLVFKNRMTTIKREKILSIQKTGNYDHIILYKNGKQINHLIHRLVAEAFIENKNNYKEVNHKDENTRNNNVDNLEWCNHKQNINYGTRTQKAKEKLQVKINQYDLKGNFIKQWNCMNEAIRYYKNGHIFDVCKGQRKTASNFIWQYAKD